MNARNPSKIAITKQIVLTQLEVLVAPATWVFPVMGRIATMKTSASLPGTIATLMRAAWIRREALPVGACLATKEMGWFVLILKNAHVGSMTVISQLRVLKWMVPLLVLAFLGMKVLGHCAPTLKNVPMRFTVAMRMQLVSIQQAAFCAHAIVGLKEEELPVVTSMNA
eukprot:Rmarinus@m.23576